MTLREVMCELENMGQEQFRRIFKNQGAPEPLFGVKVEQLKIIQKRTGKDHLLSLELFATGYSDAQYLAGLIADEQVITAGDLRQWAHTASWHMISENTVAWVAAESAHGWQLSREWINSADTRLQSTGWATLCSLLSITPDAQLDKAWLSRQLHLVAASIDAAAGRVRYTMNGFVIACGCFVPDLTATALATAAMMGKVDVYQGKTACKVPDASAYINKCVERGSLGKKKKMARC